MKICIVTSVHPPNDPRISKMCCTAQQLGHDVSLLSSWLSIPDQPLVKCITFTLAGGLFGRIKTMKSILKSVRSIEADIYHFHDLDLLPLFTIYSIFSGKSFIYDVHENYSEEVLVRYWIPNYLRIPLYWIVRFTQKACSRVIGNCIIVTESVMNEIHPLTKNVLVHKNFASVNLGKKLLPDYDNRQNIILFTGSQYLENGTLLFLDIAKKILSQRQDVVFHAIDRFGNNSSLRSFVISEANTGVLKDKFILLPNIPSQSLMTYINKARIGVSPNLNVPKQVKAIPTKLFEYMAGGIPIVASDLPYNKMFVGETGAGLLADPENPETFAEKINFLLDNPIEAKKYGSTAMECFYHKFSWESQNKELEEFYQLVGKG